MEQLLNEIGKGILQQGLVFAILLAIIVTGIKATWVPGFFYRQMKEERDQAIAALDKFVVIHEQQTTAIAVVNRELRELREMILRIGP